MLIFLSKKTILRGKYTHARSSSRACSNVAWGSIGFVANNLVVMLNNKHLE